MTYDQWKTSAPSISPEEEREMEARRECERRGIDPDEICADGGVTTWMVVGGWDRRALTRTEEEHRSGIGVNGDPETQIGPPAPRRNGRPQSPEKGIPASAQYGPSLDAGGGMAGLLKNCGSSAVSGTGLGMGTLAIPGTTIR